MFSKESPVNGKDDLLLRILGAAGDPDWFIGADATCATLSLLL